MRLPEGIWDCTVQGTKTIHKIFGTEHGPGGYGGGYTLAVAVSFHHLAVAVSHKQWENIIDTLW